MNTLQPNKLRENRDEITPSSVRFTQRRRTIDVKPVRVHAHVLSKSDTAVADCVTARWFVYMFALKNGSAFELGFSSDPLHHLRSLAARFHERFDLQASVLLSVDSCARARQLTAKVEQQLVHASVTAPSDLARTARDTQWFNTAHFSRAQQLLTHAMDEVSAPLLTLAAFAGSDFLRLQSGTEAWAFSTARRLNADIAYAPSAVHLELARALRDCLDAYRALRVPLFATQPEQGNFVWQIARLYRPALTAIL